CFVRLQGCNIIHRRGHKRLGRNRGKEIIGEDEAQTFGVKEEKGLVLADWTANRYSVLVRVGKGARNASLVEEKVVGVHVTPIPPIQGVAVELVGSGFGDVSNLRAGELAVFAAIRIGYDRGCLHLVLADRQVGCARIVDIEVRSEEHTSEL